MNDTTAASDRLNTLLQRRLQWVEATRENNFGEGISRLLSELYPDEAHFIYELLQNAEDAGATTVDFRISNDGLRVIHDGSRLFSVNDVESITSIGHSTKRDDVNKIGKFGVGFKAVFSYTNTPRVFSGGFSFEIRDLVCPHPIPFTHYDQKTTCFEFPFNARKSREECCQEIATGLANLPDTVLLFLMNIRSITWSSEVDEVFKGGIKREEYKHNVVAIEHRLNGSASREFSYWLRYTAPATDISSLSHHYVAVAFKLGFLEKDECIYDEDQPLVKQMQIVETKGQLAVFFPAEKEDTRLRFHLHAPYASTVARDSIPTQNKDNQHLLQLTAKLIAESLPKLKSQYLLTREFLAVLPNPGDNLSAFYAPVLEAIKAAMNNEPLVPDAEGGHAIASSLFEGVGSIRNAIPNEDLEYLSGKPGAKWVVSVMQNQRADRLLKALGINVWNWDQLYASVSTIFGSDQCEKPLIWLRAKESKWLRGFYALLGRALKEKTTLYRITEQIETTLLVAAKRWPIVRTDLQQHLRGPEVYFPNESGSAASPDFPTLEPSILAGEDKATIREATDFLNSIGVRHVGEWERIEKLLQTNYSTNASPPSWAVHVEHIRRFIAWAREKRQDGRIEFSLASRFQNWPIFKTANQTEWQKPERIFIDSPYEETGLADLYVLNTPSHGTKWPLAEGYLEENIPDFLQFAIATGVSRQLLITRASVWHNPHRSRMDVMWNNNSTNEIDSDFRIDDLKILLSHNNPRLSLLVWKTMNMAKPEQLQACYRRNSRWPLNEAPSQLVCMLISTKWIPHKNGGFHTPRATRQEDLLPGFLYDNRNGWLGAVEFSKDFEVSRTESRPSENAIAADPLGQAAVAIGVPRDILEMLANDTEAQNEFKAWREEKLKRKPKRPEAESGNPLHREKRVAEQAGNAAAVERQERVRTVRVNWETKEEARTTLRELNTNEDGEMICQICGDEMPFKLDNGQYYFEAVECVAEFQKELPQNYIALCPVCSAKFRKAIGTSPAEIKQLILNATGPEISVILARERCSIIFTKKHLLDLQVALRSC